MRAHGVHGGCTDTAATHICIISSLWAMPTLSGRVVADEILEHVRARVQALSRRSDGSVVPHLVIMSCDAHQVSEVYIRSKKRAAERVGVRVRVDSVPANSGAQSELLRRIHACNVDRQVHAIIVQLPLAPHVEVSAVLRAVDPRKDVDALSLPSVGELACASRLEDCFVPATALGVLLLLRWVSHGIEPHMSCHGDAILHASVVCLC